MASGIKMPAVLDVEGVRKHGGLLAAGFVLSGPSATDRERRIGNDVIDRLAHVSWHVRDMGRDFGCDLENDHVVTFLSEQRERVSE